MLTPLLLIILPIGKILALAVPVESYPLYPTSTNSTNTTTCVSPGPTAIPIPQPIPRAPCPRQTIDPSTLTTLNSLYPRHPIAPSTHFIALRDPNDSFQLVQHIQFLSIDPSAQNCSLQLVLPAKQFMSTGGKNPVLQVWQVKAAQVGPEGVKWTDFVLAENSTTEAVKSSMEDVTQSKLSDEKLKDSSLPAPQPNQNPTPEHLTLISGDPDYLNSVRRTNGVIGADGHVICNRTLTFQIGILKPRPEETQVSYWDFINVSPPANPVQGWQVVAERTEC